MEDKAVLLKSQGLLKVCVMLKLSKICFLNPTNPYDLSYRMSSNERVKRADRFAKIFWVAA